MAKRSVSVRADTDTIARIDRLAAWLVAVVPGVRRARTHGLMAALLRGLEAYEREIAASPRKARSERRADAPEREPSKE